MSECFPCDTVEQTQRKCRCGEDARPNQRDCHTCHAKAQVAYRARQKNRHQAEHAAFIAKIAADARGN